MDFNPVTPGVVHAAIADIQNRDLQVTVGAVIEHIEAEYQMAPGAVGQSLENLGISSPTGLGKAQQEIQEEQEAIDFLSAVNINDIHNYLLTSPFLQKDLMKYVVDRIIAYIETEIGIQIINKEQFKGKVVERLAELGFIEENNLLETRSLLMQIYEQIKVQDIRNLIQQEQGNLTNEQLLVHVIGHVIQKYGLPEDQVNKKLQELGLGTPEAVGVERAVLNLSEDFIRSWIESYEYETKDHNLIDNNKFYEDIVKTFQEWTGAATERIEEHLRATLKMGLSNVQEIHVIEDIRREGRLKGISYDKVHQMIAEAEGITDDGLEAYVVHGLMNEFPHSTEADIREQLVSLGFTSPEIYGQVRGETNFQSRGAGKSAAGYKKTAQAQGASSYQLLPKVTAFLDYVVILYDGDVERIQNDLFPSGKLTWRNVDLARARHGHTITSEYWRAFTALQNRTVRNTEVFQVDWQAYHVLRDLAMTATEYENGLRVVAGRV